MPALIYALMKIILTGEEPGVHESYRWGLTKLVKVSICVSITSVLQALGYALLIIPGIIVTLVFMSVYPIAVLEKGSASEALARSIELTKGHRLQIFFAWIVLGVLLIITSALGIFISSGVTFWPVMAAVAIISDILDQGVTILSLVVYLGLPRVSNSGGHSVLSLSK